MLKRTCHLLSATILAGWIYGVRAEPPVLPDNFDEFVFLNALVVDDAASPLYGFHHFYVNATGAKAFARGGPYPTGSVFVSLVYDLQRDQGTINEGKGNSLLIMAKDPDAADTGRWRFARYRADGSHVELDEKRACFDCHTQAGATDFVFSRPLSAPIFD